MLLASLRGDHSYRRWSLADIEPRLLPALVAAASRHQVLPLVRRALLDSGWSDDRLSATAPGLGEELEASTVGAVVQHLRVSAELRRLAPVLDGVGVSWAVVKGPALAELAYPHPELRVYGDLDVLVHPRSFGAVIEALEADGAKLVDQNWSFQRRLGRAETTLILPLGTCLDLHWHLVNDARARAAFSWDIASSLERRRTVRIGEVPIPTLDVEDTLLHVALHGAFSGGHRLSWIKDVAALVALDDCDWDELAARAIKARVALPVAAMLSRAHRLLGAHVPDSLLRSLRVSRLGALALGSGERLATPERLARGRHTGRLMMQTARADAGTSWAALAAELVRRYPRAPWVHHDNWRKNPLHLADVDPDGRQLYLAELGAHGDMTPLTGRASRR